MTRRVLQYTQFTTELKADTSNMTDAAHMTIGAFATTGVNVSEIYIGGQETTTKIAVMQWARNSQLGSGTLSLSTNATEGAMRTLGSASVASSVYTAYTAAATNKPQRTSTNTKGRLNLTLNAFGGIVRWFANPGEEWGISGTTASDSESSLSQANFGSASLLGAHIIFEPL